MVHHNCIRKFGDGIRQAGIYYLEADVADDYSADTSTTGTIAVGQTLEGHLYQSHGSNDDEDWVKVAMTQGTTYRFAYRTLAGGDVLPKITGIYDSGGTMVHGPVFVVYPTADRTARLEFTAPTTGDYYIGLDNDGWGYGTDWRLSLSN